MPDVFNDLRMQDCLVGIDSDGCVFPTMEIKQRQCIHPLIIKHWHLDPLAPLVRETAAFVNLYSRSRGSNRFVALCRTMELLAGPSGSRRV
ncbi:MAG: hypothetical protein ABR497_09800 [Kiritimatiellia bacterium]|nr:hypothetical protein [Lentisphaerota bacterium]